MCHACLAGPVPHQLRDESLGPQGGQLCHRGSLRQARQHRCSILSIQQPMADRARHLLHGTNNIGNTTLQAYSRVG